jgi:hypothetical protein
MEDEIPTSRESIAGEAAEYGVRRKPEAARRRN